MNDIASKMIEKTRKQWQRTRKGLSYQLLQRENVARSLRLRHGAARPSVSAGGVLATVLVKNGAYQIKSFLDYHFALGVEHVLVLDNGSTDETVALASSYDRVTVYASTLPYKDYKYAFWRYLDEVFGHEGWSLTLDIDERFDYPYRDRVPLSAFVRYLEQHGYTGVVSYLLDLFSDQPASAWPADGATLEKEAVWYDITDVIASRYPTNWRVRSSTNHIKVYGGGVRKSVFGLEPNLTKVALRHTARGARASLTSSHRAMGVYLADVTTVLLHYKFDRQFHQRSVKQVRSGHYHGGSLEYKAYLNAMDAVGDLLIAPPNPQRYAEPNQLLEQDFLYASDTYRRFAEEKARSLTEYDGKDKA